MGVRTGRAQHSAWPGEASIVAGTSSLANATATYIAKCGPQTGLLVGDKESLGTTPDPLHPNRIGEALLYCVPLSWPRLLCFFSSPVS